MHQDEDNEEEGGDAGEEEGEKLPGFKASLLTLTYSELSLSAKRARVRSTMGLKQVEWCHVLSENRVTLPDRARKFYDGSSCGDVLSGIQAVPPDADWQMTRSEKKPFMARKIFMKLVAKPMVQTTKTRPKPAGSTTPPFLSGTTTCH